MSSYNHEKQLVRKEYFISLNGDLKKVKLANEGLIKELPAAYGMKLQKARKKTKIKKLNSESRYLDFFKTLN